MAHVGIERLGAGHGQEHGAERQKPDMAVVEEEADAVGRAERGEDARIVDEVSEPADRHGDEPDDVIGPNQAATAAVPRLCTLNSPTRIARLERDDEGLERRRRELQPFDRRQHRDRRRDDRVAIEQRGAGHAEQRHREARCAP